VRILTTAGRFRMLAGDGDEALRLASEALELAEGFGLDELRAHALATIGSARELLVGEPGTEELETALRVAVNASSPIASSIVNNLAVLRFRAGRLIEANELYREANRLAERFGDGSGLRWSRGNMLFGEFFLGNWDEAEREANTFILECESSPHYLESNAREVRGNIRLGRGDLDGAFEDWSRALEVAREAKDPQAVVPSLLTHARGLVLLGRVEEARASAEEALDNVREQPRMAGVLGIITGVAHDLGVRDRIVEILSLGSEDNPWQQAVLATVNGDFGRAAEIYLRMGARTQAAEAQLNAAHALIDEGRRQETEVELQKALAFYRSVGATFFIRRAEALLPASA
jgi:tetratricopeptide (TPR) repeat protein